MGVTQEQRSLESAQSGTEKDRVGARSSVPMKKPKRSRSASVSAVRTSKKSRSEGTAQGGSVDERREPKFSASVPETSKKLISREAAQSSSDDDKMGPRTPIPFEGKSVGDGEFFLYSDRACFLSCVPYIFIMCCFRW